MSYIGSSDEREEVMDYWRSERELQRNGGARERTLDGNLPGPTSSATPDTPIAKEVAYGWRS
jgi:hypothetical protein